MRRALMLCLLVALSGTPMLAAEKAAGGGIVFNKVNVDEADAEDVDGDGLFGVFTLVTDSGFLFQGDLSFTNAEDDLMADLGSGLETVKIDTDFRRLNLSIGRMFRREQKIRPFFHVGIATLTVTQDAKTDTVKIKLVDDDSVAMTAGGGLEVVFGNHSIYTDLSFDFGYEIDIEPDGEFEGQTGFDVGELHLGYLYRF